MGLLQHSVSQVQNICNKLVRHVEQHMKNIVEENPHHIGFWNAHQCDDGYTQRRSRNPNQYDNDSDDKSSTGENDTTGKRWNAKLAGGSCRRTRPTDSVVTPDEEGKTKCRFCNEFSVRICQNRPRTNKTLLSRLHLHEANCGL